MLSEFPKAELEVLDIVSESKDRLEIGGLDKMEDIDDCVGAGIQRPRRSRPYRQLVLATEAAEEAELVGIVGMH